jgi:acyl-ACP thioesterase
MKDTQHTEWFTVRAYAVDADKHIQVPDLVRMMHETAMQHVLRLKLSVWDLEPQQLAWVLTRITVRIHRLPHLGERIRIATHPSGFERIRTYRDYRVFNEAGELLASAVSLWFLMDTASRKLARVPEAIKTQIESILAQLTDFLPRPNSKAQAFKEAIAERRYQVGYHELDFNNHLNNIYYAQWLLDAIPGAFQQKHQLIQLDIFYKNECMLDDQIMAQANPLEELHWQQRLLKEGQEVALAESRWRPKP